MVKIALPNTANESHTLMAVKASEICLREIFGDITWRNNG